MLQDRGFKGAKVFALIVIAYASAIKLINLVIEQIPAASVKTQQPDNVAECALNINNEIKRHISELSSEKRNASHTFLQSHNFETNVSHTLSRLAEHLKNAFPHIKIKNRDIFISIYKEQNFSNPTVSGLRLLYQAHWDANRDTVFSTEIPLDERTFAKYECVKAIKAKRKSTIIFNCDSYLKTKNKRGKISHYVGLHLEIDGETLGFMNIEFHNHTYFQDYDKMTEFIEKEILVFKYIIEYQFLKRRFLTAIHDIWIK